MKTIIENKCLIIFIVLIFLCEYVLCEEYNLYIKQASEVVELDVIKFNEKMNQENKNNPLLKIIKDNNIEKENKIKEKQESRQSVMLAYSGTSRGGTRDSVQCKIINKITQRDYEFGEITPEKEKIDIANTIILESNNNNVNPLTIASMIDVESRFRQYAKSEFGAEGLMQIMPDTAQYAAEQIGIENYDLSNYKDNIKIGTYYYVKSCVEAWSHNNITQTHPKTGTLLSPYEMGLMTYNGNTRTARRLSNIEYLYSVEDTIQLFE